MRLDVGGAVGRDTRWSRGCRCNSQMAHPWHVFFPHGVCSRALMPFTRLLFCLLLATLHLLIRSMSTFPWCSPTVPCGVCHSLGSFSACLLAALFACVLDFLLSLSKRVCGLKVHSYLHVCKLACLLVGLALACPHGCFLAWHAYAASSLQISAIILL